MKIQHFCNSFNLFQSGDSKIVCDPWVGNANRIAWMSYPVHKNGAQLLNKINPEYIYISHLHCDHFDEKLLIQYKFKDKVKIIIKEFKLPILKNRISKLGFKNIIELKPWKKYKLNSDISVAIIPQISSNNRGLEEQINYDLDTSIVIQSNQTHEVFYNGVDNPLSDENYKYLKKFISKNFNKEIAIAVLQDGAAGEYPQCFLNVDRKKAQKRVIKSGLVSLKKKIKILKPKAYFSAAPGAIITGKFSILNDLAAKPNFKQIKNFLKNQNCKFLDITGGGVAKKYNGSWKVTKPNYSFNEKNIINRYRKRKYFYFEKSNKPDINKIDEIFSSSYINYLKRLKNFPINTSWQIEFNVYKDLNLNSSKKINYKKSNLIKRYSINYNPKDQKNQKNFSLLKCHLDFHLFYGLLTKKYSNWNEPTAGSLVLFERTPDVFDPNVTFSLNYLFA